MDKLLEMVRGCVKRGTFELSSGGTSDTYIDLRVLTLSARGLSLVAWEVYRICQRMDIDVLAGPVIGADPIIGAVLAIDDGRSMTGLLVRAEAKGYGMCKRVEGPAPLAGSRALIIDDVVTSGRSIVDAAVAVHDVSIMTALCILDRNPAPGGRQLSNGLPLIALFELRDGVIERSTIDWS